MMATEERVGNKMTIIEEHLEKQIRTISSGVQEVPDEIKHLYGEVQSLTSEMKGLFKTLRSR